MSARKLPPFAPPVVLSSREHLFDESVSDDALECLIPSANDARGNSDAPSGAKDELWHSPGSSRSLRSQSVSRNSVASLAPISFFGNLKATARSSQLNWLLVAVPAGWLSGYSHWNHLVTFTFNFLAIVPLAKLLGFATEELSLSLGQVVGGLLSATFGNAVELIISLVALRANLIRIVQVSILGSILSNLLLVLGFCFFLGGLKYQSQSFNMWAANTNISLSSLVIFVLLLPAALHIQVAQPQTVLSFSRGTSIVLLAIYVLYLIFQLKTHRQFYEDDRDEDVPEQRTLSPYFAIILLIGVTLCVCVSSEFLVGSIEYVSEQLGIGEAFIGMIILPIVGNAAEHVSAVTFALKDKMSLSCSIAVGSSMQIALLVTPFLVLLAWAMNIEFSMEFTPFETVVVFVSVLMTNTLLADGKSDWLEGMLLLACYTVIAIGFFYVPS